MTTSAHLAAIMRELSRGAHEVPEGWFTVRDEAERSGKSIPQATRDVRSRLTRGELVMQMFRVRTGLRTLPVPHYRLVKPAVSDSVAT